MISKYLKINSLCIFIQFRLRLFILKSAVTIWTPKMESWSMTHGYRLHVYHVDFKIVYGRCTKIDVRIEDRKLTITFKVLICPKFHWSYSIEKCSRTRFNLHIVYMI